MSSEKCRECGKDIPWPRVHYCCTQHRRKHANKRAHVAAVARGYVRPACTECGRVGYHLAACVKGGAK